MTKILTIEAIKENPWFAVILPLPEAASERLVLEVFHVTALLSAHVQKQRAEALQKGDAPAVREFYRQYLEIETRADLAQVMLDRCSDLQLCDLLENLDAPAPSTPKAEKSPKQLPPNVLPEAAYWFKRQGGIDALNAGERLVLAADYQAWTEKKPLEAAKHSEADYCAYRQKIFAQKAAQKYAQQPSV